MQHTEGAVAVALRVHQNAQADQIVDLEEVAAAHHHFLVDRVVVLRTAVHRGLDAGLGQVVLHLVDHLTQVVLTQRRTSGNHAHDLVIDLRVQGGEREIFEFPLDGVHAQSVGQRGEDLERVVGDDGLLVLTQKAQGSHVVQPVGQLDHQHPDVAAHREHHLAQGLGLGRLAVGDLVELRHPVDHGGDLLAEVGGQLRHRVRGVFDRVVQQRGAQRRFGHAQFGQNRRDRQWVGDVGVAALAGLAGVVVLGGAVRALDDGDVGPRMIRPQGLHQRIQHGRLRVLGGSEPGECVPHAHARLLGSVARLAQRARFTRQAVTCPVRPMHALSQPAPLRQVCIILPPRQSPVASSLRPTAVVPVTDGLAPHRDP